MITEVRINNFMAFSNDVELSLDADMRTKRFSENVYQSPNGYNIVKSACIYGPNNMGKSCIARAISCILDVMAGFGFPRSMGEIKNLFNESKEIALGITFLVNDEKYSFDFRYIEPENDNELGIFTYEKFVKHNSNKFGNGKPNEIIYERSPSKCYFRGKKNVESTIKNLTNTNIVLYLLKPDADPEVSLFKDVFAAFSRSVSVITSTNAPLNPTINELKKGKSGHGKDIANIISLADVDISDFFYDAVRANPVLDKVRANAQQHGSQYPQLKEDVYRLFSKHNGKELLSVIYDSDGTKTLVSLAGFIVDALYNDVTIVIDEFDNGLHSSITRAIISMFNNETNHAAQLIFTSHDISLLDTKNLFRKDQIWFLDRDRSENGKKDTKRYLYRLDEFTAENDGVRSDSNIEQLYKEGYFGAMPEPDLFDVMINISESRQDV